MPNTDFKQRLAAILAADAAGYSRLMAGDDRAAVAALDAARAVFRTQIEAHQGRVIDMAGDSVLAVFETAIGAVSTALAVQAELDALASGASNDCCMRFRIGVHLGDVLEKRDGTVYGDGVNIAARLQGLAEPGGITISESIRSAVRGKVAARFEDQGEQAVKNIPDAVRTFRVKPEGSGSPKPSVGAAEIDLSLPDKASIAVLPFANLSGDPEQEYFTDGISEDIITELSRFRSLFVIARNSSFTYKGKSVDVRTVGKELGVRYVLNGSIRRSGQRVRVTGQLVDALTGAHLWAEHYDRVLEDIFAVQEELTRQIVMAIAPEIDASEIARARRARPGNLSAHEIGLRANADAMRAMLTTDATLIGGTIEQAEEALALDPRCCVALHALALAHFLEVWFRTTPDIKASYQQCVEAVDRALAVDLSEHRPHLYPGLLEVHSGTPAVKANGLSRLRRAYEQNANDPWVLFCLATGETVCGDYVKGRDLASEALRMNPRDPARYLLFNLLAQANFLGKQYQTGLDWAVRSTSEMPKFISAHVHAALNYVGLGRITEAMHEVECAHRLAPEQLDLMLHGMLHCADPEHRQRATTFLRIAAGLESPAAAESLR